MTIDLISLGALMVEVMRPEADMPLDEAHPFYGPFPSGAAAITTSAAARLGWKCAFVGIVGDDPFGKVIYERLRNDGVNLSGVCVDNRVRTGVAFVSYKSDGSRTFSHHIDRDTKGVKKEQFKYDEWGACRWLHISGSSITSVEWRDSCRSITEHVRASGGKLSFDPNLRIPLQELKNHQNEYLWYISQSEIFQPNEQELLALFPTNSINESIKQALEIGPSIVVVKRGKNGCVVATKEGGLQDIPGIVVNCKDPTGAGDTFNAAFLVGIGSGMDVEQAAILGNVVAGISTTKLGPMEGCPTLEDLESFLIKSGQKLLWDNMAPFLKRGGLR